MRYPVPKRGDNPPPPQILQSTEKTQALLYIGGGLPPSTTILIKRRGDVKMAELLPDHLSLSPYTDEDRAKSTKVKYKEVLDIIEWL